MADFSFLLQPAFIRRRKRKWIHLKCWYRKTTTAGHSWGRKLNRFTAHMCFLFKIHSSNLSFVSNLNPQKSYQNQSQQTSTYIIIMSSLGKLSREKDPTRRPGALWYEVCTCAIMEQDYKQIMLFQCLMGFSYKPLSSFSMCCMLCLFTLSFLCVL